jgi:hypothetical protein
LRAQLRAAGSATLRVWAMLARSPMTTVSAPGASQNPQSFTALSAPRALGETFRRPQSENLFGHRHIDQLI